MNQNTKGDMLSKSDYQQYLQKSIGYEEYMTLMAENALTNPDAKYKEYIVMNQHRETRVSKTYHPSPDIVKLISELKHNITWLIITEHWCGDASQTLPVLNAIARMSNGKINMRLVFRDENPELMDAYLTNGTRSIPRVIQLNEDFVVTGSWGPRPKEAQKLVLELKANPETAADYGKHLHLWYAKDKQHAIETEISSLLAKGDLLTTNAN